jgi:hypothetical protein
MNWVPLRKRGPFLGFPAAPPHPGSLDNPLAGCYIILMEIRGLYSVLNAF